jgi:outer membrane receptor protein involved in Fe transport
MLGIFGLRACASILALACASHAYAAEAVANGGEEIVVTAQKIEQRAVDVPITISAISGDRMRELGVSDLDELSNYVPGLNIQEQSANNPGIVIRGITSDSGSAQQAPRVTLYYNGVDISRSRGSYQDIYDVERIEVIKGPQATLFGTASAVGAISIISARPKPGVSGQLTAGLGNFDQRLLSGYLNAGSDKVAGRIAFAFKKRDGYVNNLSTVMDDLNGQNQLGLRGSLRLMPTERLTIDLIGTYDRQRNPGTAFINRVLPPAGRSGNVFGDAWLDGSPVSRDKLGLHKLGLRRDVYDGNLTANLELDDSWNATLVAGYRKFDSLEVFDADGSRASWLEFAEDSRGWQGSVEARFTYTSDTLRGSFGFNAFHEKNLQRVPFATEEGTFLACTVNALFAPAQAGVRRALGLGASDSTCIGPDNSVRALAATRILTGGAATALPYASETTNRGKNDSYSVFGDMTWIPDPSVEITGGVRALIEKRNSGYSAIQPNSVLLAAAGQRRSLIGTVDTGGATFRAVDSFQAFLPRFNLLYRFSDAVNAFGTISKGRRSPTVALSSGAGATGPVPVVNPVTAENVWNYEVGLKGATGIVSGSIGLFYQTYDNFQVSVINPQTGVSQTQSAGSAKNLGVEAEVLVKPARWFSVFGNIGYIDGGIDDKPTIAPNFRDARFRLQPEVQAAGGFTIDAPIGGDMRLFASPSVTYRSRIFFEVPNNIAISQDAVTLVNVRAGLSFANDTFEVAAFARNLTNKDYLLDAGNTGGSFGYPTYIPAEPRLYGAQITARF